MAQRFSDKHEDDPTPRRGHMVITPEGISMDFDAIDTGEVLYEVKT